MGSLITLLSGGAGIWVVVGSLLAAGVAGGVAGYEARGVIDAPKISHEQVLTAQAEFATQQCVATHEKGRADQSEQVIHSLTLSVSDAAESINNLAAKAAARGKSLDQFKKDIKNATPSKVCGSSAAELAYRNSVLRDKAAAPTTP